MSAPEPTPPPRLDAEMLRTFLAQRDAPCPACNYNLRGLNAEKCPECAVPLSLSLSAVPPISRGARRGILAFGGVLCLSSLILAGFSCYWAVRWMTNPGFATLPPGFAVRAVSGAIISSALALAAVVALLFAFVPRTRTAEERSRRCLRFSMLVAGACFAHQIVVYLWDLFLM